MALSEAQIYDIATDWFVDGWAVARAIKMVEQVEYEVHKSDEALIRQLVDALGECKDSTQERIDTLTESGIDKHKPRYFRSYVQDLQRAADAISAANARLEGKP